MIYQRLTKCYIVAWLFFIIFFNESSHPVFARSLEEIKQDGEIRLCIAGSSHKLYSQMGTVFAEHLGVKASIKRLDSWDHQFHNKDGVTIKETLIRRL